MQKVTSPEGSTLSRYRMVVDSRVFAKEEVRPWSMRASLFCQSIRLVGKQRYSYCRKESIT